MNCVVILDSVFILKTLKSFALEERTLDSKFKPTFQIVLSVLTCLQIWAPWFKRDQDLPEGVQERELQGCLRDLNITPMKKD